MLLKRLVNLASDDKLQELNGCLLLGSTPASTPTISFIVLDSARRFIVFLSRDSPRWDVKGED